jgi:hypothetical protein
MTLKTNPDLVCTVPKALRLVIPVETPEQIAVCVGHDMAYNNGGTRRQRALADAKFLIGLLETGMDPDLAESYYVTVRAFGLSHWRDQRYVDEDTPAPRPSET